ncbi:hypothetical protein ACVCAH_37470 [Micromonospora sp. LZ34]
MTFTVAIRATRSGCTTSGAPASKPRLLPHLPGPGELIDHILASRDLQLRLVSFDSLVDDITSIGASTLSRAAATVPDHAPVIARFTTL